MKKYKMDNLYESKYPLENTNNLWADKDENTGKLRAMHQYNRSKGEWEPTMISVDYLNVNDPDAPLFIYNKEDNEKGFYSTQLTNSESGATVKITFVIPESPFIGTYLGYASINGIRVSDNSIYLVFSSIGAELESFPEEETQCEVEIVNSKEDIDSSDGGSWAFVPGPSYLIIAPTGNNSGEEPA